MPVLKLLNAVLFVGLILLTFYYMSCSVGKYVAGKVAVSTTEQQDADGPYLQFPSLSFCIGMKGAFGSMWKWARGECFYWVLLSLVDRLKYLYRR